MEFTYLLQSVETDLPQYLICKTEFNFSLVAISYAFSKYGDTSSLSKSTEI